ncbi:MAG: efflux RND transporter periplasmic adaptor subunit [Patescibacteria group bacterium]
MKKKVIISIIIIALIGTGAFLYYRHKKASSATVTYQTAEAAKGTLVSTVTGTGNITVSSSANVSPSISGTVTGLKVAVGDQVKSGQTLFTIINDDLDVTVSKAYTSLLQSQQKLSQAQSDLTTSKQDYEKVKKTAVTQAQLTYDQAVQALAQAKVQLSQDQATLDKYETDSDAHSDYEISLAEKKVTVDYSTIKLKESDVTSTQTDLTKAKAGTSDNITSAKSKVDTATINVQAAENDVASAKLDYENQQKTASERTVTAPISGTVTAINVKNNGELSSSSTGNGSSATNSGSSAIVIQDLTSLKAVVSINEVDIASVKVGQKTSMTFDAVSDLTQTGSVEVVDTAGTSTQGVVTYSATIGFDSLDSKVKPEMSVNATITTDVKQDVLMVSSSAIKTSGTTHYVQILKDGSPIQQTVEIGSTSDTQTEITSGLSEGDSVITQTITTGSSSTNSNANSSRNNSGFDVVGGQMFTTGTAGGPPGGF